MMSIPSSEFMYSGVSSDAVEIDRAVALDARAYGIGKRAGLFVYFFYHKVRIPAFFGLLDVPLDGVRLFCYRLAVGVVKFLDVRAFERGRGGDRGFVARVEARHEGVRHVLVVVAGQHEQQGLHGVLVVLADLGAARRITLRVGLAAGAASRGERYAYTHVERLLLVRSHRIGTDRFVVAAAGQDRHGECAGQKMFPAFHDFVY